MCADYHLQAYWERRYEKEPDSFEWYQNYAALKPHIYPYVSEQPRTALLHVGCGNSRLGEGLYRDGITHIVNIDSCRTVIDVMNNKHKLLIEMKYLTMDVRDLKFDDETFDVCLDKGTLDCFACGEDAATEVSTMLKEVNRVLKPGGVYICISFGTPNTRAHYFQAVPAWTLESTVTIDKPKQSYEADLVDLVHYIYVLRKQDKVAAPASEPGRNLEPGNE
ncbi:Methyltransferase type 11 domain-containing protein [Plasmodiophora brassicae]|uniref:Methyltransferase type 11 domain-containing protein n=1 Tax=Plasmodiophora brassicae TaxID=37360 RepID=A0A0G4IK05_PLABS|nr:hypothetical protein PBRA_004151 [Plasmodiophora brassicae]SPR00301.1 unnamed protein product [Plasmodiophora brassicae]